MRIPAEEGRVDTRYHPRLSSCACGLGAKRKGMTRWQKKGVGPVCGRDFDVSSSKIPDELHRVFLQIKAEFLRCLS